MALRERDAALGATEDTGRKPAPTRTPRRAALVAVVLLVLIVAALVSARETSQQRLASWLADCRARAGSVQTVGPADPNPLLSESRDPTYRCRGADGRVVATWR